MDQIKKRFRDLSLRASFVLYVFLFILVSIVLIIITMNVCVRLSENINANYSGEEGFYYLLTPTGEQIEISGDAVQSWQEEDNLSEEDKAKLSLLNFIMILSVPVYSILCLIIAASLFYRRKISKPFSILHTAQEKIACHDLEFTVSYNSQNEMGQLVSSFEKMRAALQTNNLQMWRQMEQRKQINAAFAHDLRTPLTVLKGYSEMLQLSPSSSEVADTAQVMEKHIGRLERYVDSMSNLQKMEDIKPDYIMSDLSFFSIAIEQTAVIICEGFGKQFLYQNKLKDKFLKLDKDMILEVVENLVSNAAQYAEKEVCVKMEQDENYLMITITDDGRGFSPESLIKAADPYYSGNRNRSKHFGLGLYISKILCEQHMGSLTIKDMSSGAQVAAVFLCQ